MNLARAIACYEAGDKDAARLAALAIPPKNPDYAGARNLLAVIAQDQGQQTDAETFAREAIAAAPGNALYLNTLGNGLLAQGRSEEAVAAMADAHAAMPDQPDILFNLGATNFSQFRHTIDAIRRSDWLAAHDGLLASLWHKQVGRRAERDALMILTNEWPEVA